MNATVIQRGPFESNLDALRWQLLPEQPCPRIVLLQPWSQQLGISNTFQPGLLYLHPGGPVRRSISLLHLESELNYSVFQKGIYNGGFIDALPSMEDAQIALEVFDGGPHEYDIVETRRHLCVMLDTHGREVGPLMVYMSGTKLGVSHRWIEQIESLDSSRFSLTPVWRLAGRECHNGFGRYYNFRISLSTLRQQ